MPGFEPASHPEPVPLPRSADFTVPSKTEIFGNCVVLVDLPFDKLELKTIPVVTVHNDGDSIPNTADDTRRSILIEAVSPQAAEGIAQRLARLSLAIFSKAHISSPGRDSLNQPWMKEALQAYLQTSIGSNAAAISAQALSSALTQETEHQYHTREAYLQEIQAFLDEHVGPRNIVFIDEQEHPEIFGNYRLECILTPQGEENTILNLFCTHVSATTAHSVTKDTEGFALHGINFAALEAVTRLLKTENGRRVFSQQPGQTLDLLMQTLTPGKIEDEVKNPNEPGLD